MKYRPIEVDGGILYQGDCIEVMNQLPEASVDLVFGSPPYEEARLYLEDGKDLGIARKTEEWVAWMVEVFKASLRVSKGLVAYVVGHGKGARKWSGAPALLCADMIRSGVNLRSPLWFLRKGMMGGDFKEWFRTDLEWIICATNCSSLPWSDNTACGFPPKIQKDVSGITRKINIGRTGSAKEREPITQEAIDRNKKGIGKGEVVVTKTNKRGKMEVSIYTPPDKVNPGNVINCGFLGNGKLGSNISHENEAAFPEKLPNFFIKSFCPPGGVVLDPFMGSGTTAAVAIKTGRKFIGIDLRPSQIKLQKRRVAQAHLNKGFQL